YILDASGMPAPIGVAGELYVGGAGVARGYLNRPELTAERFLDDPFAGEGERMYRTGDLGRWCADGTIDYLGRNDSQVKIRGFRIELGEIASVLQACDDIKQAIVMARGAAQDKRLVAYCVPQEEGGIAIEALKEHLSERLPAYMVPAAYVVLAQIPLTPNGKVDSKALPEPGEEAFSRQAYTAPQGREEVVLAGIWQELLALETVGRQDDFFALGGHSLLAVQLISRIRSELNRELPLAELFARPALKDMAAALGTAGKGA
ncbi:phosphopantetheine-binding protein, partial [Pectobacterium brasiliense]|uniref:phosphopantetheine-binding protein n=2 Tax=Pectobacterium TaxID=122277 RepID=UPI0040450EA0